MESTRRILPLALIAIRPDFHFAEVRNWGKSSIGFAFLPASARGNAIVRGSLTRSPGKFLSPHQMCFPEVASAYACCIPGEKNKELAAQCFMLNGCDLMNIGWPMSRKFLLLSRFDGLRGTPIATRVTVNGHLLLLASSPTQSSRATCQPQTQRAIPLQTDGVGEGEDRVWCTGYGADTLARSHSQVGSTSCSRNARG